MTTASSIAPAGWRVRVQRFGSFLSGMVMPNIAAFIAWGLITAFFIPTGWTPNADIAQLVGPMIQFLLPLLIANTGGRLIYDTRGGVIATIAAMGVIVGAGAGTPEATPMFLGAMIVGPLAAWIMKQVDKLWAGRIKAGFEMLVDNFSGGIVGGLLAIGAFFGIAPVIQWISNSLEGGVNWLVETGLLPLTSLFIEPGKVLFLNNAINHGVLTPLGAQQSDATGQSIAFLLETNPGPGLGILLAFMVFGAGIARASAPGAIIIHFFGGIHEIYFPYVLMRPLLIVAVIAGGMSGVFVNVLFDNGLRAAASPGSIFAIMAMSAPGKHLTILLAVLVSAAVSFLIALVILRSGKQNEGDLEAAIAQTQANKGKESSVLGGLAGGGTATKTKIETVVFACDAGMGSSAMGASVLRKKFKEAGLTGVKVENTAIANLKNDVDLVVTQGTLTDRARQQAPGAIHVSVENFLGSPAYDEIVELVQQRR